MYLDLPANQSTSDCQKVPRIPVSELRTEMGKDRFTESGPIRGETRSQKSRRLLPIIVVDRFPDILTKILIYLTIYISTLVTECV